MPKSLKQKKQTNDEIKATEHEVGEEFSKRLRDFEQTYPVQLQLFEDIQSQERQYSNTVEPYDFMPKYYRGNVKGSRASFWNRLNANLFVKTSNIKSRLRRR